MKGVKLKRLWSILMVFCLVLANPVFMNIEDMVHAENGQASENIPDIPSLLITEVAPDTTDVEGTESDGYEFIEVYNPTDQAINFKDYTIIYRYPSGPQNDVMWTPELRDIDIQPGGVLVIWLGHHANQGKTVADFNANFGIDLVENVDIVKVMTNGMVNKRKRNILVATNSGHEIVDAAYNNGTDDVEENMGIFYKYPEDGSNKMMKINSGTEPATPGSVYLEQVPEQLVHLEDTTVPSINNLTETTQVMPTDNVEIVADAEDDNLVRTMTLYYKNSEQDEYTAVNLSRDREDSLFQHTIDFLDIIGSEELNYYFEASDGFNKTTSEIDVINVVEDETNPRLNVQDGDILSGEYTIKGTSNDVTPDNLELYIDGSKVSETFRALENSAFFTLDVEGINATFQNAVTMGEDIIQLIDYAIPEYTTVAVPIDPARLVEGGNTITFRAGSVKSSFETRPEENLDDFNVKNVRLILADGTVLRDPQYSDPELVFDMGDGGRYLPFVDFTFDISAENMTSLAFQWDTTSVTDGEHHIKVVSPNQGEATANVLVDNSKPVIETTLEEDKEYKGDFVIDATVKDEGVGIEAVDVTLDDESIELPYKTSSAEMTPGEHILHVSAKDKAGNTSGKTVHFSTVEEMPVAPKLLSPENGASDIGSSPTLSVNVADPTNDDLDVTFYQGIKYNVSHQENVKVYKHSTGVEPPQEMVPEGEEALTAEEYEQLLSRDGQYVITDSTTEFPYLRFEVQLDRAAVDQDVVELLWEGKSLEGRKVTMYAWNHTEGKWIAIDTFVPKTEDDFILTGDVSAEDYVKDDVVNVLIQDEIPPPEDYDYTFVWMTDTQFYTELYPSIFEEQVNWIRDNKDAMNIQYVFHTGDVVNEENQIYEWEFADRFMGVLEEADIPYGMLAGNHDIGPGNDYTRFSQYFGAHRFQDQAYYGESYKDNRGHYDLISANGNDYIMVYMGWGVEDEDIDWMNDVLAAHPDRMAILSFHRYLQANGDRAPIGEEIFENVVAVLSGHHHGSALLVDEIDDDGDGTSDRKVYQMLHDYQAGPEGGQGYMRLLQMDTNTNTIHVNTYSPYKDDYNFFDPEEYPGKDEFTISLDLEPQIKRVATDYFEVSVYTDQEIGTVENIPSGQSAAMTWGDLEDNQTYYWYAVVKDNYGGQAMSDIWHFTTGETEAELPAPENLRATGQTDTTIDLAWDPSSAVDEERVITYDLYMGDELVVSTEETVYMVEGLRPGAVYTFAVVARDEEGTQSEPSTPITVSTQLYLSSIRQLVDDYIESGDLKGSLAKQLNNKLKQVEHHFDKGSMKQAMKFMQDFLQKLNHKPRQNQISPEAKDMLNRTGNALLNSWRNE